MKLEEITQYLDNTHLKREQVHYKTLNQDCIQYKDNNTRFTCTVDEDTHTNVEYLLIYKGETSLELLIKTIHTMITIGLSEITSLNVT